ncbi:hypothetical protein ACN082_07545 [Rothia sp. CCM 9417]|uniref:hypothetical protein n=1 Tax=Rothia sp. CCM 9417 TaxID=3402657 RepID=UPI003AE52569
MADIRLSYELLQDLIDTFREVKDSFTTYASSTSGSIASDDPVAHHHSDAVMGQEDQLLTATVTALGNAQEGAQSVYDDFKTADGAGGSK